MSPKLPLHLMNFSSHPSMLHVSPIPSSLILLWVHRCKPGRTEIRNTQHSASTFFPVNVTEATWRNRQTSSRMAPWTQARSPTGSSRKIKITQHAYEEGHRRGLDYAKILGIESNGRFRKYKESAHMACLTNPISQPYPIWIPLISNEVSNSWRRYCDVSTRC
jgi:hypothetical protein